MDVATNGPSIFAPSLGYMPENDGAHPRDERRHVRRLLRPAVAGLREGRHTRCGGRTRVLLYVGLGRSARCRVYETYSTGMKQRIKLAQALVHDPDLLFLDEPTNGMDPKGREEMLELIRDLAHNKGMSLILSSHLLPDVEYTCDHVVVLDKGAVATAGPIDALKGKAGRVYEVRVKGDRAPFIAALQAIGWECRETDEDVMRVVVAGAPVDVGVDQRRVCEIARQNHVQVRHVKPSLPTLEDVFAKRDWRTMSPIHDQTYRRYEGTRAPLGRAWTVILGTGLRAVTQRRFLLIGLVMAWIPFIVRAVQIWAVKNFQGLQRAIPVDPQMFRQFVEQQGIFVFFVTILRAGARGSSPTIDLQANALQIYLSKPLLRMVLGGKLARAGVVAGRSSLVPALLLPVLQVMFSGSFDFMQAEQPLGDSRDRAGVFDACSRSCRPFHDAWLLSALSNNSRYVAMLFTGAIFFTNAVFGVLSAITGQTRIAWVSISANLSQVTDVIFRREAGPLRARRWQVSLLVLLGLVVRLVDLGARAPRPRRRGGVVSAILAADHLSKWYGQVIGLNDVSVSVGPGITGLLGPNGAGKSTFMKLITGQLRPSKGSVHVLGEPIWGNPKLYFRIGFCPEQDAFYERMTGLEWVTALVRLNGLGEKEADEAAKKALTDVDLMEAANKKIGAYSKGMRQRVKMAQALVHDPELLILDEPLSGMDPLGRRKTMRMIREWAKQGKSVVVSSHILHEVEAMTPDILLINNGRILAEGNVHQIRDLIDSHPHSVYVRADDPRGLAREFLSRADVISLRFEPGAVVVETGKPDEFYSSLTDLVAAGACGAVEEVTFAGRQPAGRLRVPGQELMTQITKPSPGLLYSAMRVFDLSLGEMLWSRRTIFMFLVVGVPVLMATIVRLVIAVGGSTMKVNSVAVTGGPAIFGLMIWAFYVRFAIPVLGAFYGTALIADEVDDKTITYLFTRPIPRSAVLVGKFLAYLVCTMCVVMPSIVLVWLVIIPMGGSLGESFPDLVKDLGLLAVGLAVYGAVFAYVGSAVKRPLLVGLFFVIGWENAVMAFPGYLKRFTVSYYVQGLVPHAMPNDSTVSLVQRIFRETPSLSESVIGMSVILFGFLWLGARTVSRREYVLEQ